MDEMGWFHMADKAEGHVFEKTGGEDEPLEKTRKKTMCFCFLEQFRMGKKGLGHI